jgi:hypothetical protein
MEKLFAALIPVVCVMALGPLCCQVAGSRKASSRRGLARETAPQNVKPLCE